LTVPSTSKTYEVAIVGAGIIGASIAFHVAAKGLKNVALIDRSQYGHGSTARATGGIRHQFSSALNVALSTESVTFYRAFEETLGAPLEFRQIGYLFLAESEPRLESLRRGFVVQTQAGVRVDLLNSDDVRSLCPWLEVVEGTQATYCPDDGVASPVDACAGFVAAARRAGVELLENTAVTGITQQSDRVTGLTTTNGSIGCNWLIIATGVWAPEIGRMVGVELPITPNHRQVCLLEVPKKIPYTAPFTVDLETGGYFHAERSGLIVGGTDHWDYRGFDDAVDWQDVPELLEAIAHRVPAVRDLGVKRCWAGLREMTPDEHPIVGPVGLHGVVCAAGFSGHGFMHAPAIGRRIAEAIVTNDWEGELGAFALRRFDAGFPHRDMSETHVF
jgi:sarcosine oxidase subunit beta